MWFSNVSSGMMLKIVPNCGMPYHDLSNKTTRSHRRHVLVYVVSSKEYKYASTFLHSSDKHLSSTSNSNSQLHTHCEKMKVRLVFAWDDHGKLTRLYSSLLSVASLLLRSSVSRLLPNPMHLTQIPRTMIPTPAHPIQPSRTRLTQPKAYELITHARELSFNKIVGVYPVQVQDTQKRGRTLLRQRGR